MEVPIVLERLGSFIAPGRQGLGAFEDPIADIGKSSPLADTVPDAWPAYHRPLRNLYELVRMARNDMAHEGAHARQMSTRAVELAITLEDALMADADTAADFMVPNPEQAHPWEPISFLRQKMLVNSFTYLPVWLESGEHPGWKLVSDGEVAGYLRGESPGTSRGDRISESLASIVEAGGLELLPARKCHLDDPVSALAEQIDQLPWLVVSEEDERELHGILTAFDLL